jgi:uncharacterized protein
MKQQQTSASSSTSVRFLWLEIVGLVWFYYSLVMACIAVPPLVVPATGLQLDFRQGTSVTFACVVIANLVALKLLSLWLRYRCLSWSDLGWLRPTTNSSLVAAFVVALAYGSFTLALPEIREHWLELSLFKVWGAGVSIFAGAVEEVLFRGLIMTELHRSGVRSWNQVLVSGLTFGVVHMGYGLWGILMTFLLGVALAWIYLLGRRSLTGPIVCHSCVNLIIEPWLLLFTIELFARLYSGGGA